MWSPNYYASDGSEDSERRPKNYKEYKKQKDATPLQRSQKTIVALKKAIKGHVETQKVMKKEHQDLIKLSEMYRKCLVEHHIPLPQVPLSNFEVHQKLMKDLAAAQTQKAKIDLEKLQRENKEAELRDFIQKAAHDKNLDDLLKQAEGMGYKSV